MARLANPALIHARRRQIMDAAMRCFRRRGIHPTTMREICEESGLSPGHLYRYYDSKSAIIIASLGDWRSPAEETFLSTAKQSGFLEALCRLAEEAFEHRETGALIAETAAESMRDCTIAEALRGKDEQTLTVMAEAIQASQFGGCVDRDLDPRTTAALMLACINGIAVRRGLHANFDVETAIRQFRAIAERYLSPPRAAPSS